MKRAVAASLGLLAMAGCAPRSDPGVMLGYGEARYVYIAAEDTGRIGEVLAEEGERVQQGAALFRLEPERLALNADSLQADAAAADMRARRAGALAQASEEARAQARLAQISYERSRALLDQGFVAQARLDADKAALDAAEAALRRAEAEQEAARLQTAALSSAASLARRRVVDLTVAARQDGVIHRIYRRQGEVVSAGEPLAALMVPGGMRVRFFAPEPLLVALPPGARVALACDACAEDLEGRVSFVASEPQFTPPIIYSQEERGKLVFLVEAIPDDPMAIRPGLPVEVRLLPETVATS